MPPHDIPHDPLHNDLFHREPAAHHLTAGVDRAFRVGIGGPVGSGKTTLVGSLCRLLRDELSLVVVTNDIFTSEDAQALRAAAVLPADRIAAVETGCCPHTAIRDDIAANLDAVEQLETQHGHVDITLVESGGDNLTAIFSRGLVDVQIFVIDTAGGDDIPRKGGPGVALADLLVVNKVDLAPYVHADVDLMFREATDRRHGAPVLLTSLVEPEGAAEVAGWLPRAVVPVARHGVRARATIAVARRDGRDELVDRRSQAPFSVRRCGDRIMVASSAAMPVGGDELDLTITVDEGARAAIGSVAATMVWPGPGSERSRMSTVATVAGGGRLDLWVEPTVSVTGSWHRAATTVRLAGSATCRVVEEVVLGRTGECAGRLDLSLRVERDGRVLVHHDEAFGPDVPGAWSAVSVGRARHVLSAVLVGVDAGRSRVRVENGRAMAWLPVHDDAVVIMAVGPDRPAVLDLVGAIAPELVTVPAMACSGRE